MFTPESVGLPPTPPPTEDGFAPDVPPLDDDVLRALYQRMLLARRFEEQAGREYARGRFAGFLHLYIGEEAVAFGIAAAMGPRDAHVSHYREHVHALAIGVDPDSIMAELFGKATGCSGGRGGSMHLFDASRRFLGGDGIVGGQIPLAAGAAWALRARGEEAVALCTMGDAAVNQGTLHEALNMASRWKLPVVYVIENNLYGMGTPIARSSATATLAERAAGFSCPGVRVDGQHVFRVYEAVWRARQRALAGEGPTLIEALTYRYRGHSMSDPATYRTREEVERFKQRDPIEILGAILRARGLVDDAFFEAADQAARERVREAVRFAAGSPAPPLDTVEDYVLTDSQADTRTHDEERHGDA